MGFFRAADIRKPDLFIVGAPKSGTTSLYTHLQSHPDIFMSSIKEPQYFAADICGEQRRIRNLAEYMDCFTSAKSEKRIGEASTAYLASRAAVHAIKELNADANIIIMLRNPVEVMYALHSERVFGHSEHILDFEEAIDSREIRIWRAGPFRKQPVVRMAYREVARFSDQVQRYFDVFGREKMHVIVYEDLKKDFRCVYQRVLDFLDVRSLPSPNAVPLNSNRRARSLYVQGLIDHPPPRIRAALRGVVSKPIRHRLAQWVSEVNVVQEPRPPMDQCLRRRLQQEYRQEVIRLSALLNRDLTEWCRT